MRWGLVPSFAKNQEEYNAFKGGNSTFNARIEGAFMVQLRTKMGVLQSEYP